MDTHVTIRMHDVSFLLKHSASSKDTTIEAVVEISILRVKLANILRMLL